MAARAAVAAAAQSAAAEDDLCGSPGADLVPVVTGRPGGRAGTRAAAAAAAAQGDEDDDDDGSMYPAALQRSNRGQAAAAAAAVGAAFGGGPGHSSAAAAAALEEHFGQYYQQQRLQEQKLHQAPRHGAQAANLFGASPMLGGMLGVSPKLPGASPMCNGLLGGSPMLGTSWGNMHLPLPNSLGGSIPGLGALVPELHSDFMHGTHAADTHMGVGSFGMPMSLGGSFPGLPSLPGSLLGQTTKAVKAAPPPGTAAAAAAAAAAGNRAIQESIKLEHFDAEDADDFTRSEGTYGAAGRHQELDYHDEFEDELMAQMDVDDLDHSGSGELTGCSPATAAVFQELMKPWTAA